MVDLLKLNCFFLLNGLNATSESVYHRTSELMISAICAHFMG